MGNIKGYNRKQNFNSMAPEILKWEARADQWANTFVNNIAWVGPITEYNRNNATLSIMEGLGSFANTKFGDMSNELKQTLLRHGITGYEWRQKLLNLKGIAKSPCNQDKSNQLINITFFCNFTGELSVA